MAGLLVVDPQEGIEHLLDRFLKNRGISILTAGSGDDAISKIESGGIQMVLAEIAIPYEKGLKFVGEVRKKFPELPVYVMTAYSGEGLDLRSARVGAQGFLTKPFQKSELIEMLDKLEG